ncbi:ABC transporter permease subunit [Glycomyces sp. NRRL B-16210]|uniref:ABC transporter permease subunit n=1 Tax=Glycomyces sp. NRRL B-16210 TaxID=1463821 RepID=UPI000551E353|nr:ABC transporter permease subunit [Glycomyces sp. NRRL B-16210]
MNLFKAELRRIVRRRLSLIFGILVVAAVLVVSVVTFFSSSKGPTESALAEAQAQADAMNAEYHGEYAECMADEAFFEGPGWEWTAEEPGFEELTQQERCEWYVGSPGYTAEDFLWSYTFDLSEEGVVMLIGLAIVAGLVMMLLASSAIGAEWSSGGMSNLLVWHPNRLRVWGVKLAASCAVCAAVVIGVLALAFGLLFVAAAARGEVGTLDAAWWEETLQVLGRTVALTLGMTVLGASLAMLGRHTAIAGGVIAGYLIVGDMLVRVAGMALRMPFPDRLSLYTWVTAWVNGRIELYDWSASNFDGTADIMVIKATEAGLLLGAVVLGFALLATLVFRRRDVG